MFFETALEMLRNHDPYLLTGISGIILCLSEIIKELRKGR